MDKRLEMAFCVCVGMVAGVFLGIYLVSYTIAAFVAINWW